MKVFLFCRWNQFCYLQGKGYFLQEYAEIEKDGIMLIIPI